MRHVIDALLPMACGRGIVFVSIHVELDPYGCPEVVSVDGRPLSEWRQMVEREYQRCTLYQSGQCDPKREPKCYICADMRRKMEIAELMWSKKSSAGVIQAIRHLGSRLVSEIRDRLREEARKELLAIGKEEQCVS